MFVRNRQCTGRVEACGEMMHQRHDRFSTAVSTHANLFITRLQKTQHRLEIHRDQYFALLQAKHLQCPIDDEKYAGCPIALLGDRTSSKGISGLTYMLRSKKEKTI